MSAFKGNNMVEWEGNVSILEKSFETIFPCLFLQDRQGGWSSLNKEFPLTKWASTKLPNLKPAALLTDKRNMALVEEALDAVVYIKKQIEQNLVDENAATKAEQDGLLAFKHLSKYDTNIFRRMEVAKQFMYCNEHNDGPWYYHLVPFSYFLPIHAYFVYHLNFLLEMNILILKKSHLLVKI